jgi:diguanylate cyclase (GGDEF)-like protein
MKIDNKNKLRKITSKKLYDIESKGRFSSVSIGVLSNHPKLLKEYLEESLGNTFSELMFRLTHEVYSEDKANKLWNEISAHRLSLKKQINRDMGMLVAALDYLSNITFDIKSPKIIEDLRMEESAVMATRDSLTGLYLRNVFLFSLERLIHEHSRYNKNLSLILMDIDDFKDINNQYGHQAGDKVLHIIGNIIINTIRKVDIPARYGGDEIAIILPETSVNQATTVAYKLSKRISHDFTGKADSPTPSVSIGISYFNISNKVKARELIYQADNALYGAKNKGKNKIEQYLTNHST